MKKQYILILIIALLHLSGFTQERCKKRLYKKANRAFDTQQFHKALKMLIQYDSICPGDYLINYKIGACYLNSRRNKDKAIRYLEFASKKKFKDFPPIVLKSLGDYYLKKDQINKADKMFSRYVELTNEDNNQIKKKLKIIHFKQKLIRDSIIVNIENLGAEINTLKSEESPYVSANDSILFFQEKETNNIFFARNQEGKWFNKTLFHIPEIDSLPIVKLAGISPRADLIFLQMGDEKNTDLYACYTNKDNECDSLFNLGENINSPYEETTACLSINEQTLYFSSNREGGYGMFDLYKSEKDSTGKWQKATNLGSSINTKNNELFPFLHPNRKKLYFASNGHCSVGGLDIFKASITDNHYFKPENIGYPINSKSDERGFSMTKSINAIYFSSSRDDITLHYDIYKANIDDNLPITIVKENIKSESGTTTKRNIYKH